MKRSLLNRGKALRRKPAKALNPITKICVGCSEPFVVSYPSWAARQYCSRACAYVHRSEPERSPEQRDATRQQMLAADRTGKRNPNFRHGRRAGWHIRAFNLRLKGETCCRVCGTTGNLHLHHIIPRSTAPGERAEILNGLPLCGTCHTKWHRKTQTITRDVFTNEEWAYLIAARIPGRVTSAWLDDHYPTPAKEAA